MTARRQARKRFHDFFANSSIVQRAGFVRVATPRGLGGSRFFTRSLGTGFLHLEIQIDDLVVIARAAISEKQVRDIDPIAAGIPEPWPPKQPCDYFFHFHALTSNTTSPWRIGLALLDDRSLQRLSSRIIEAVNNIVLPEAKRLLEPSIDAPSVAPEEP
ncbi:MAG: hypothetical protein RMA76_31210 [Deltaproteobacteria bacterium]|jgi:hypothetical protein